jgi:DNA gyrase subunit B
MAVNLTYGANSIKTMKALEHMRHRAGSYGFDLNTIQGNFMQVKETLDNAVDEALDKKKHYNIELVFFVKGNDYQFTVRDYGRGIPIEKLEPVFTVAFTSGKYEDGSYEASVGTNGVGSKVTAALSKRFVALTKRQDGFGIIEVGDLQVRRLEQRKRRFDNNAKTDGTIVFVEPEGSVLRLTDSFLKDGMEDVLNLCRFISAFFKNITITVRKQEGLLNNAFWKQSAEDIWKRLSVPEGEIIFQSDESITPRSYVQHMFELNKNVIWDLGPLSKEQRSDGEDDRLGFDIDLFLDEQTVKGKRGMLAAVNRTPITRTDASHLVVVQRVLKQFLTPLIENKDLERFFDTNYEIPLSGSIMVFWRRATFVGQDKRHFRDVDFESQFRMTLRRMLLKRPDSVWECLYDLIVDDLVEKYNRYTNKALKVGKGLKGIGLSLNNFKAYSACNSTDNTITELYIAEGDSAGGRIKDARDEHYQAVFKLRGKPINASKKSDDKVLGNLIYQDLTTLLNVKPNTKDLSSMNFSKIIIATDADSDGAHITGLLIDIIRRINPEILAQGRLYYSNPPLYAITTKSARIFLRDQAALDDAKIETLYHELLEIELEVGSARTVLTGEAFHAFCKRVVRLGNIVNSCATTLSIEPLILEQLLHVVDFLSPKTMNTKEIKKRLNLDNAIYHPASNNLVLVADPMEIIIPLERLEQEIRQFILPEYELIHWDRVNFYVTTKHTDLYNRTPTTPVKLFRDFTKMDELYTIRRYKGLGEMSVNDLAYVCMDPATRCFTRITSVGNLKAIYDMLGVKTEARKRLVMSDYLEPEE